MRGRPRRSGRNDLDDHSAYHLFIDLWWLIERRQHPRFPLFLGLLSSSLELFQACPLEVGQDIVLQFLPLLLLQAPNLSLQPRNLILHRGDFFLVLVDDALSLLFLFVAQSKPRPVSR